MRNVEAMPKYCVLCGRQWGPYMRACCTPTSLVAVARPAFLGRRPRYYDLDGRELSETQLLEIEQREREVQMRLASEQTAAVQQPIHTVLAEQPAPAMQFPVEWVKRAARLRAWFGVYIAVLIATWTLLIVSLGSGIIPSRSLLGLAGLAILVSYLFATVQAYKLQKHLDAVGLRKPAARQILLGAFVAFAALLFSADREIPLAVRGFFAILSPYMLGFFVPYSVLRGFRRTNEQLAALASGQGVGPRDHSKWQKNAGNLRLFFRFGVLAWCVYLFSIIGYGLTASPDFFDIFLVGLVSLYIFWFPVVIYAYRVQRDLHRFGLYKHGEWHVVVAGLLVSPLIGLYVGFSVLRLARRVKKHLPSEPELARQGDSQVAQGASAAPAEAPDSPPPDPA
jgi:hypothetical protein